MSVVEWYRRRSSKTKRRLESAWATGLFVFVAYLSPYIASPNGVTFDKWFLGIGIVASLALNVIARRPKIRSSGNHWVTLSNSSVIWLFGMFFGALSAGLPTMLGLISQFPYAAIFISGAFLLYVFEQIDLNKETDELLKPEQTPKEQQTKRLTLRHWISDSTKRVREFGEKHPRSSVSAIAIFTGLLAIYFSIGDDRQTLSTAAQSMIQLAAFLAGASGVLSAIYLTQVLTSIPENVRKGIPDLRDMIAHSVATAIGSATDPEEQVQLARKGMDSGIDTWKSFLKGQMSGVRRIRNAGISPLILLVTSAISSILVILIGSAIFLGTSVGLMILATWMIFRSWKVAEESIEDALFVTRLVG